MREDKPLIFPIRLASSGCAFPDRAVPSAHHRLSLCMRTLLWVSWLRHSDLGGDQRRDADVLLGGKPAWAPDDEADTRPKDRFQVDCFAFFSLSCFSEGWVKTVSIFLAASDASGPRQQPYGANRRARLWDASWTSTSAGRWEGAPTPWDPHLGIVRAWGEQSPAFIDFQGCS